jgi:MarR family transcriptional repressor of emrRAB
MENIKRITHTETEKRVEAAHQRAVGEPLGDIKLALLVKYNARLLSDVMDKALEPYGISGVAYVVMMTMFSTTDDCCNPSDICIATGEGRSNMTRITDELVKKGLIKRVASEEDRRRIDLSLTEAGIELLRVVVPEVRERNKTIFSALSPEAKVVLEAEMITLKNALEEYL